MPALQALTGGKLLFSPCNPFSAFYAYSGAAAPSNALSREWWGAAPHPASFWKPKGSEKQLRFVLRCKQKLHDKFQFIYYINKKSRKYK